MVRMALLVAALFWALASAAGAEVVNRIAAVVNGDIITHYQLETELAERIATGELRPEGKEAARRAVLEQLIEETLIRQRVDAQGLKVSEQELAAAIQDVLKQNKLTQEQLETALRQQGMSFDAYRENLRQQMLRYKLIAREVQNKTEVTTQEIRDYFRENIDRYREPATLRLNRMSFPLPSRAGEEQRQAVRRKAEEALGRLRKGEDFTTVLLAFSADRSAEGGDMGLFAPEDLTPAFARAVGDLPVGGLSDLVETPQGFHILQVSERNPARVRQFDSVKDEIAKVLGERKSQARLKEWAAELRDKAEIEVRL